MPDRSSTLQPAVGTVDLGFEHETLGVYQQVVLLRPFTFLSPS
jgi:hypothetical protein